MTTQPRTEEEALLMYATGLEYLKRTGSKLLPAAETVTAPEPKKKPTQVDFSSFSQAATDQRLKDLERQVQELSFENSILKSKLAQATQPNTWPLRPTPMWGTSTEIPQNIPLNPYFTTSTSDSTTPDAYPGVARSKITITPDGILSVDGVVNVDTGSLADTVTLFGDVTFSSDVSITGKPRNG